MNEEDSEDEVLMSIDKSDVEDSIPGDIDNHTSNTKPRPKNLLTNNVKKKKPGIVYLSYIPQFMNVTKVRELFTEFGVIGRLFLQPDKPSKKGKPSKQFTEGWVEFLDKRIAKSVATVLNGKQIGGKRKCPWYDSLWSIKYLHRFKWTHLNEKLAYEKAVRDQRMRNEISQAKKEANFYTHNSEQTRRRRPKRLITEQPEFQKQFSQKATDEEMRSKQPENTRGNKTFLQSVFGSKK